MDDERLSPAERRKAMAKLAQDRYRKGASRERYLALSRARAHTERQRTRKRAYAQEPHERTKRIAYKREYYARHHEEILAKRRAYTIKYMTENPDLVRAKKRDYYRKRRERILATQRVRQTALPKWADREEIIQIYRDCPSDMEVDHIVPLKGRTVDGYAISGLHVPWNLQYLTRQANLSKHSRMRPEDQSLCEGVFSP